MHRNINRQLATETFRYGRHYLTVSIRIRYTNQYNMSSDILNRIEGYHYYRFVKVAAVPVEGNGGRPEVKHQSSVALDREMDGDTPLRFRIINRLMRIIQGEPGKPRIPEHVEQTVDVVIDELDEMYGHMEPAEDIEVDVAMDRVEAETSWVEVDSKLDEFSGKVADEVAEVADEPDLEDFVSDEELS